MFLDLLFFQSSRGLRKLASAVAQKNIIRPNYSGWRHWINNL